MELNRLEERLMQLLTKNNLKVTTAKKSTGQPGRRVNRSLALLKGAFLYITGFGESWRHP